MKNLKVNIILVLSLLSIVLLAACSTEKASDQGAKQNNQGDTFANSSDPVDSVVNDKKEWTFADHATKTLLVWHQVGFEQVLDEQEFSWKKASDPLYYMNINNYDREFVELVGTVPGYRHSVPVNENTILFYLTKYHTESGRPALALWDTEENRFIDRLELPPEYTDIYWVNHGCIYSYPGSEFVLYGNLEDDEPRLFVRTSNLEIVGTQTSKAQSIYYSLDGSRLIIDGKRTAGNDTTEIWDMTSDPPKLLKIVEDINVAYSPDLKRFATFNNNGLVVKDAISDEIIASLSLNGFETGPPVYSPDGKTIFIVFMDYGLVENESHEYKVYALDANNLQIIETYEFIGANGHPQFYYSKPSEKRAKELLDSH